VPQPTTPKEAVADLHALLSAAGETGPYVLVGHSYGGLVVKLYARTYPKDVAGLVLVDALSEGLQDALTPEQWTIQRMFCTLANSQSGQSTLILKGSALSVHSAILSPSSLSDPRYSYRL